MNFCEECGVLLVPDADSDQCKDCNPTDGAPILSRQAETVGTELEKLSSTKSGAIRKKNAMKWLQNCERPNSTELKRSILPKPAGFRVVLSKQTFRISELPVMRSSSKRLLGFSNRFLISKMMRHVLN